MRHLEAMSGHPAAPYAGLITSRGAVCVTQLNSMIGQGVRRCHPYIYATWTTLRAYEATGRGHRIRVGRRSSTHDQPNVYRSIHVVGPVPSPQGPAFVHTSRTVFGYGDAVAGTVYKRIRVA
jgi:hypothetical protein